MKRARKQAAAEARRKRRKTSAEDDQNKDEDSGSVHMQLIQHRPAALPSLPPPAGVDAAAFDRMMAEHWLRNEERVMLERQAAHDPAARLHLEKMIQLVANAQHHTHSHTHSHTHLHIHPSGNNPSGAPQPQQHSVPLVIPMVSQPQPSVSGAEAMMQLHAAAAARPPGLTLPTVDAGVLGPRMALAMQEMARANQLAGLGLPPGADPMMAERLLQQRQLEFQRQFKDRQSILQHNEMMRRLQQEGSTIANLPGVIRPPHP